MNFFEKAVLWLLTKFPNDKFITKFILCKHIGHDWEEWSSRAVSKYHSYKTRRNYFKCSKCGKEVKNI